MKNVLLLSNINEKHIKHFIFFTYIFCALLVGSQHEPWADEAQSWLIARDTKLEEMLTVMAYEGSPALWPILLKLFIFVGWEYHYLFVIPIIFGSLGVWLLIYKSQLPLYAKILLPFTYYIFFQYTIIARSYCLVLPCIMWVALAHEERIKKPFRYAASLFLLSSISVHMMLLSGILYILFLWDIIQLAQKTNEKKSIRNCMTAFGFLGLTYLFTISYLWTPNDISFQGAVFDFSLLRIFAIFFARIGETFVGNELTLSLFVVGIYIFGLIAIILRSYILNIPFLAISSGLLVFLTCFYCNKWHVGLIFLSALLAVQIYPLKTKHKNPRMGKIIFFSIVVVLCIQINWSIRSSFYDLTENYSGAKAAAEYIKANNFEQKEIYGLGYYPTALEPYFNSNIYVNRVYDNAYYVWSYSNGDMKREQILANLPDVVVCSEFEHHKFERIIHVLYSNNYKLIEFDGTSYIKNSVYESQKYYVYVRQ